MKGRVTERPFWMSGNAIAIGILLVAYLYSVVRFIGISYQNRVAEEGEREGQKVIRVTHWQLEPGFREAMDWAIEKYNELPHVKEAGIRVKQLPITERVYNQFMNVHLISGTAPDIAAKGQTRLIRGTGSARFYTPLSSYANAPNPYNAPELLPKELPEKTKKFLSESAWAETFVDGMEGGYDYELQDYYAVPLSVWGGLRIFYNVNLLKEIKAFARQALAEPKPPVWVESCWLRRENGREEGYLPDSESLREWLTTDAPPETLGQLMFYCTAVQAFAKARGLPNLVPISGSNYEVGNLAGLYFRPWLNYRRDVLDWDKSLSVSDHETFAGWQKGKWSMEDEAVREYFNFAKIVTSFFPRGYVGLDREQAQRRFISGNAAMISSGGWDAGAIFSSLRNRRDGGFPMAITPAPYPAPDERWYEYIPRAPSEANFTSGVPLAINRASPNFPWALDFLRFLTSMPINEEFNQRAGWLPAIEGAQPTSLMKPFTPEMEGADPRGYLDFGGGMVQNVFSGQSKVFLSGDISYEDFAGKLEAALKNPRHGAEAFWESTLERANDRTLVDEAMLNALRVRDRILNQPEAAGNYYAWIAQRTPHNQGRQVHWFRYSLFPEKPLPKMP